MPLRPPRESRQKIDGPSLEEYAERYDEYLVIQRWNGIAELRMHTNGGPLESTMQAHSALARAWRDVGADPENHVIIITGTGDNWALADPELYQQTFDREPSPEESARAFHDAARLLENLVFGIDVPTIAAINGPGPHTEFALACDITFCSENTVFFDPHFRMGLAPGDGQGLTLQELLGTKRAAYYLYTGEGIDASTALAFGLVNDVVPSDQLMARAWALAEAILQQPVNARQLTHAIVAQPWRRRIVRDLRSHLSHELAGIMSDRPPRPT